MTSQKKQKTGESGNRNRIMPWSSLPDEVQLRVVSFLATTPAELSRIGRVSKSLHRMVHTTPSLWRDMAERKFGRDLAHRTLPLYDNNEWKAMLRDDNRRGAALAVTVTTDPFAPWKWKSYYRFNQNRYFFCCLIAGLKYDRSKRMLYLYLDVRGESDLRHPSTSFLGWSNATRKSWYSRRVQSYVSFLDDTPSNPAPSWGRGHYKCVVGVDIGQFPVPELVESGTWSFFYACRPNYCDYEPIPLFESDRGQSIESILSTLPGFRYSSPGHTDEHPFANDTEELERKRWEPHVPECVMQRTTPRPWWV